MADVSNPAAQIQADAQNQAAAQSQAATQNETSAQDDGEVEEDEDELEFSDIDSNANLEDLYLDAWMDFDDFLEENSIGYFDCRLSEVEAYFDARFWKHPGILYTWFEPSYLPGCKPRELCLENRKVDYEHCTASELKRMIVQRGLCDPFPEGVTLKYYYLHLLENADKDWHFRFMDLPPEMRLVIYRELLIFPGPSFDDRCTHNNVHPTILRTCKQINHEASDVLYHDNVFSTSFQVIVHDDYSILRNLRIHNKLTSAACPHLPNIRLPTGIDTYPEFFRRISNLEIDLKYTVETTGPVARHRAHSLNHFVATLSSFLMDGHQLKTIKVRFEGPSDLEDAHYSMILYPLRRIRNISNIIIEGRIPVRIQRRLIEDLTDIDPIFNTMRQWKLIEDEALAQFKVLQALHGDVGCTCVECIEEMPRCMLSISTAVEELESVGGTAFFSSASEEFLIARLSMLRRLLHDVNVATLKDTVTNFIRSRRALRNYEAVADDGRLDEAENIWREKCHADVLQMDPDLGDDWSDEVSEAESFDTVGDEVVPASSRFKEAAAQSEDPEQLEDTAVSDIVSRASPEL